MSSIKKLALIPILLSFFVMGFADFAAISSNYVKISAANSASVSSLLPTIAYLMCPLLTYPAYRLTEQFGSKRTIMLSLFVIAIGALLPLADRGVGVIVSISLILLGTGGTILLSSLVPLLASIVKSENLLPLFSLGQCLRFMPTMIAPLTIVASASAIGPHRSFEWSLLCVVYAVLAVFAFALFAMTPLEPETERRAAPMQHVKLLKMPIVLFTFFIVFCNMGIDVGMGAIMPELLSERLGVSIVDAIHSSGIYYLTRSFGCLVGALTLSNVSNKRNFFACVSVMAVSLVVLLFSTSEFMLLASIALTGVGSANIFAISFCKILKLFPMQREESSALTVTAFSGGAVLPMFMAFVSDWLGIEAGVIVMLASVLLMIMLYYYVFNMKKG